MKALYVLTPVLFTVTVISGYFPPLSKYIDTQRFADTYMTAFSRQTPETI